MNKVMIYISEDFESYGYKSVNFDFKKGQKLLVNGKPVMCISTNDVNDDAFQIIKMYFHSMKNQKVDKAVKAAELSKVAHEYSGEAGGIKATREMNGYKMMEEDRLEHVLRKLESF